MNVTIGMTAHNCLSWSKLTIDSIYRYTEDIDFNFIIVDNASTDGSVEYFHSLVARKDIPKPGKKFEVVTLDKNYGCARSFNEIFKRSGDSDYVVLINNDIVPSKKWLKNLIHYMNCHPEIGICSPFPVDNHINDETKINWFGNPKTESDLGQVRDGWFEYAENIINTEWDETEIGAHGSAFCFSRNCIDDVGMFDERFIQGCWEDVDQICRAERCGYLIKTTHQSVIFHWGGTVQSYVGQRSGNAYQEINKQYFQRKWNIDLTDIVCCRGMLWKHPKPGINERVII